MPYIKPEKREDVIAQVNSLLSAVVKASDGDVQVLPGILNYCITVLVSAAYKNVSGKTKLSYADHNSAVGMLECAKLEFYRRQTAPYEDEKLVENGDV